VAGINWLGILQPEDASLPAQPGGCAQCHAGLGAKPNLPPTEEDLANVDCLICHSPDYERTVLKDEEGNVYLGPAEGVDITAAAQNAQRPTREMCTRCHLGAAGGPNFKHGDYPTSPEVDVHMAAGLQCVDCHVTQQHKVAGGGYMIAQELPEVTVACANCHTEEPHQTGASGILNMHTARIACQTCHIPFLARDPDYPTQMTRDYTGPVYNEAKGLYGPAVSKESNVIPTYFWWDYPRVATPPWPVGSIDDTNAKITPWKPLEVTVPFDAETETPIYIKQGVYQIQGDLTAAVEAGVAASGQEYSGEWVAVTELMYFDAQHQVAPAAESLTCGDCHAEEGRLDFVALGYDEERAARLVAMSAAPSTQDEPTAEPEPAETPEAGETPAAPAEEPATPPLPAYPIEAYQGTEICAQCHDDRHTRWAASNHANAYADPIFQDSWADQDKPKYCLACHTTGFSPVTGDYALEGVTCEGCHAPYMGDHPPERMPVDRTGEICGTCHTVSYDEWEGSIHHQVGTDCLSCHEICSLETHEVDEEDVAAEHPAEEVVCANCHHPVVDEFVHTTHANAELDCLTCHMQIGEDDIGPEGKIRTAHDFEVKAAICVECHADTIHGGSRILSLQARVEGLEEVVPAGLEGEVEGLRTQVTDLERVAEGRGWAGGVVGALGGLAVGAAAAWLWRRQAL
jgi:hypothetical protein